MGIADITSVDFIDKPD
jgi:HrpA-like RNA helicase